MRRRFLTLLLGVTGAGIAAATRDAASTPRMKVLIKSAWGSADPTQASFPFHHANAFAEAGHDVQIFILGEAVTLMRTVVANAIVPVGWPPLAEVLQKVIAQKIPIHV
jgi:predicted peroxiredoxin